ncbi:MAG: hypothetical protein MjAS7_2187 [Metallosphaera javensis (ex Sakai et al. 2022)]|nr:MAG: hypothetical protein MjAS7_2187 [Metallosphaera javensis (ex Sakai et al. 2022)]
MVVIPIMMLLFGALLSFMVGGNNAVPGISILIATNVIKRRYVIVVSCLAMFLGAYLGSIRMVNYTLTVFSGPMQLLQIIGLSSLLTSLGSFYFLNRRGIPTSLSQMLLPSLVILSLITSSIHIYWSKVDLTVISWVIAPIASAFSSIILINIIRKTINRFIDKNLIVSMKIYKILILISSSLIIFVLGANTIGLIISVGLIGSRSISIIVPFVFAVMSALGVLLLSKRSALKMGFKLAKLNYSSSSSVMLSSFLVSEIFTLIGIPISLTQVTMGGIMGISLLDLNRSNIPELKKILTTWSIAPTVCLLGSTVSYEALLSILLHY